MADAVNPNRIGRAFDRAAVERVADWLAVAVAVTLPWSTSISQILIVAWLVALIKPQFEAGRHHLKKGVVRDPRVHAAVCDDVAAFVAAQGWQVAGVVPSPITGGDGNHEFLIGASFG